MSPTHRAGYEEAVIFCFHDAGSVLIEHRPAPDGTDTFIPNGSVEERDAEDPRHDDRFLAALHREVDEEFQGQVAVDAVTKLCEHRVEAPALWFHAYAVTDWTGTVPEYTVEDGERFAELEWIPLSAAENYLEYPSARAACAELEALLAAE